MSAQHSDRHGLAGEHACNDIGQLVLLAVFLVTWGTDSFLFHYSTFIAAHVPRYVRLPAGAATLLAAALLALGAHRTLFDNPDRKPGVIREGAFSLVRHPMYLGSWLFSAGLVLMTLSLSSAAVSIALLVFYYLMARYEERLLLESFGSDYREYQARVPMLFPLKLGAKPATRRSDQDRERGR
jgi:protein-S-isoprenylcysteine O-methyltransferase Ste14